MNLILILTSQLLHIKYQKRLELSLKSDNICQKIFYYAQICSYLLYNLIIWGFTFSIYLKKLITLQIYRCIYKSLDV